MPANLKRARYAVMAHRALLHYSAIKQVLLLTFNFKSLTHKRLANISAAAKSPAIIALGLGGQPGTYISTGTTASAAPTIA